jgi:hypothetical protein
MKAFLCIAVIAVVNIVIVPIEGQTKGADTGSNQTQSAAAKKQEATPATTSVNAINEQAPTQQGKGAKAESNRYFERLVAPENAPNLVLCVVGIAGIGIGICTLCSIRKQADVMEKQLGAMKEAERQTDCLIAQASISGAAAKIAADAAQMSARVAAGVSVPTLVVDEFATGNGGDANLESILQFRTIRFVVKNYGQTPALLHSWTVVFACEDLPDVPVYFGFPGSGMIFDKVAIQPNESYTLPQLPSWNRQQLSADDVADIIDRKKILRVYGYVAYGDIFGNPLRRMKFCETAMNFIEGSHPMIGWFDQLCPPAYRGTDEYPIKSVRSGAEADN